MSKRLPMPDEAKAQIRDVTGNALDLIRAAESLAATGTYGVASSLTVLAFEEAVKARTLGAIVMADAQQRPPMLPEKVMTDVLYRSHERRHGVGVIQHLASEHPQTWHKVLLGLQLSPEEAAHLAEYSRIGANANGLKQRGFYVDFDAATGVVRTPAAVTAVEYEETYALVRVFVDETARQAGDVATFFGL